jgi:type I restriction enzyme S subunit
MPTLGEFVEHARRQYGQQAFAQLLKPAFDRQEQNEKTSATLAALRDTLLPKLISGQLRVSDASRFTQRLE